MYYIIENKHRNYSKITFLTEELSKINIMIYPILSLVLIDFSKTVQDKYSFTTKKNLDTAPFPNSKSLEFTASLVLH